MKEGSETFEETIVIERFLSVQDARELMPDGSNTSYLESILDELKERAKQGYYTFSPYSPIPDYVIEQLKDLGYKVKEQDDKHVISWSMDDFELNCVFVEYFKNCMPERDYNISIPTSPIFGLMRRFEEGTKIIFIRASIFGVLKSKIEKRLHEWEDSYFGLTNAHRFRWEENGVKKEIITSCFCMDYERLKNYIK